MAEDFTYSDYSRCPACGRVDAFNGRTDCAACGTDVVPYDPQSDDIDHVIAEIEEAVAKYDGEPNDETTQKKVAADIQAILTKHYPRPEIEVDIKTEGAGRVEATVNG